MATRSEEANALIGLLQDRPVAYHPMMAKVLGGVKEAIFVCQLLYWHGKGSRGDGFIWKTREEFEDETGLTRCEQETARRHLRDLGVLKEKRKGVPGRMHYKLDTEALNKRIVDYHESTMRETNFVQSSDPTLCKAETPQCIPETTTEITTEEPSAPIVADCPDPELSNSDIAFYGDDPPPQQTPTKKHTRPPSRDVLADTYQQALRKKAGEIEWLQPGTVCGDHPYRIALEMFCAVNNREIVTLGEKQARLWLAQFEKIANVGEVTAPPGIQAQAIKAIRDDWNFKNKRWTKPYSTAFVDLLEHTSSQIMTGTFQTTTVPELRGRYQ